MHQSRPGFRPHPGIPKAVLEQVYVRQAALKSQLENELPTGEFVIEFGCGHGHFLSAYAEAHPLQQCMGIDLVTKRIEKANTKLEKRGLANARFLKAEALEFIECLPEANGFAAAFMLFPDPWPKVRHAKNRMLQADFLSKLAERMPSEAPFYFRTDHDGLKAWALERLLEHADWQLQPQAEWPFEQASYFQNMMEDWHSIIATRAPKTATTP